MLRILLLFTLLVAVPLPSAQAIIVAAGDGRLPLPPTGLYSNSGDQYIGKWGDFSGTAIGPHHFLTAVHVRGGVGDTFTLANQRFVAMAQYVIPGTDLSVWRVAGTLPQFAPIYDGDEEIGKEAILYGCGFERGASLQINGETHGWLWGDPVGTLSWGWNRVAAITPMAGNSDVLVFPFSRNKVGNIAGVANGDSGGGVFLHDGSTWKLGGVLYATSGRYSRSADGHDIFMATLWDARGLYQNVGDRWEWLNPATPLPVPTLSFATRISPYAGEIQAIIAGKREAQAKHPLSRMLFRGLVVGGVLLVSTALIFLWLKIRKTKKQREISAVSSDP